MFVVTEEDEAAIRAVYQQRGEFAAAIELRQRFPGITDNAQARECARTTAAGSEAGAKGAARRTSRLRSRPAGSLYKPSSAWVRHQKPPQQEPPAARPLRWQPPKRAPQEYSFGDGRL